jgi:hypothetical protein
MQNFSRLDEMVLEWAVEAKNTREKKRERDKIET